MTYLHNGLPAAGSGTKVGCVDIEGSDFELTEDTRNLDVLGITIFCNSTDDPCAAGGIDNTEITLRTGEGRYTHSDWKFNVTTDTRFVLEVDAAQSHGNYAVASTTASHDEMILADMPIQGYAHHYRCFGTDQINLAPIWNNDLEGYYDDFASNVTYTFPDTSP